MHEPQPRGCENRDRYADCGVHAGRCGIFRKGDRPGRDACPDAERQIDPLLQLSEGDECAERDECNSSTGDPRVPGCSSLSGEVQRPGGERQAHAEDDVYNVDHVLFDVECCESVEHDVSPFSSLCG